MILQFIGVRRLQTQFEWRQGKFHQNVLPADALCNKDIDIQLKTVADIGTHFESGQSPSIRPRELQCSRK